MYVFEIRRPYSGGLLFVATDTRTQADGIIAHKQDTYQYIGTLKQLEAKVKKNGEANYTYRE